jgi:hypothetical protein
MSPSVPEPDDRAETTATDPDHTARADGGIPPARCGTMFLAMQAMRDDSPADDGQR